MTPKKIFICAGELSGDKLGAGLIHAIKKLDPHIEFFGIPGPEMITAGCKNIYPIETLSVMGIFEVIPKLPQILSLRHQVIKNLLENPPDMYIGVDAPDFNLPIEAKLKSHGIKTIHYVSPSVWAWRPKRVVKIKQSVDLLLCLFPFEKDFLEQHGVPTKFVGHRSADILPDLYTKEGAREELKFNATDRIIAILPGSRSGEIQRMLTVFLQTARRCFEKNDQLKFVIAAVNEKIAKQIQQIIQQHPYPCEFKIIINQTYAAIKASDVVLATSGTITLETFLLNKPMVVAYKMNLFSWWLVKLLVKVKFCALPNLLAKKAIVPEFLQNAATPEHLATALMKWLENPQTITTLKQEYAMILQELRANADHQAAQAVLQILRNT